MKHVMLICFLICYHFGFSNNINNDRIGQQRPQGEPKADAFLTSFIEGNELYLSIPEHLFDVPMLFRRYDDTMGRHAYMQVTWSLLKDKIILKTHSVKSTAGIIIPFKKTVPLMENILAIYSTEKKINNSKGYCINITDLVLKQNIEWGQRAYGYTGNPVPQISVLLETKNLESEVLIKTRRGLMIDQSKVSIPIYFGFCALGDQMKARRYDYRMGFSNEYHMNINYGIGRFGTNNSIANIARWRLEKKYRNQKVSLPVKPITFILSPEIPKVWRPYIKAGIEEWLPAFEEAGFKNAVIVKEVEGLDDWERNSINNNIVYWGRKKYFRGTENDEYSGTVQKITDYRTGEILKSDIYLNASRKSFEDRYFIRAAPLDKRAQKFPFPNELVGAIYQCLAAHEVGHAFGLMDANYGEATYPVDKMNDIDWLARMQYTPSVMNYTRPNNITQPEDSIPPSLLIQKVGPTDKYNIRWAYTEFPNGMSNEHEVVALEKIIRLQDSISWYRYTLSSLEVIGPSETNEVVESNDPVKSTKLALKNLKRVLDFLPEACSNEKDNTRIEYLYDKTIELWYHHMKHVVSVIGGYNIHYKSINQPGSIYTPITLKSQNEAMEFLIKNAFLLPDWLTNPPFVSKMNYSTYPDKFLEYQQFLLFELLRTQRMKRLEYMEKLMENKKITRTFLTNLQLGLFEELYKKNSSVSPRRQEIQSTYLDKMTLVFEQKRVNISAHKKFGDYSDYSMGLFIEQLEDLKKMIEKKITKVKSNNSRGHWRLCLKKIEKIL